MYNKFIFIILSIYMLQIRPDSVSCCDMSMMSTSADVEQFTVYGSYMLPIYTFPLKISASHSRRCKCNEVLFVKSRSSGYVLTSLWVLAPQSAPILYYIYMLLLFLPFDDKTASK